MLTSAPDYITYGPSDPWFDYAYRSQIGERRLKDRTKTAKDWQDMAKYGRYTIGNFIFEMSFEF